MKQTSKEKAFHTIKNAKLDYVQKIITITKELAEVEKELLPLDPNLSVDQVFAKRISRMRELEALDREYKSTEKVYFDLRK